MKIKKLDSFENKSLFKGLEVIDKTFTNFDEMYEYCINAAEEDEEGDESDERNQDNFSLQKTAKKSE